MTAWLAVLLHAALVAAAAPVLDAGLRAAQAWWRGLPPPPPAQPWRDLRRLWRKPALLPSGASVVFAAAPSISLAAAAAATQLTPSFTLGAGSGRAADLVVAASLLVLSRAAPALAAHDTGAQLGAYGSTLAMTRHIAAGPVLLLSALVLMLLSGSTNLDATAAAVRDGGIAARLAAALTGAALLLVSLRGDDVPVDAFSGRAAALLVLACQLRLVATLSIIAAVAVPYGIAPQGAGALAWMAGALCWAAKLAALAPAALAAAAWEDAPLAAALLALTAVALGSVQAAA